METYVICLFFFELKNAIFKRLNSHMIDTIPYDVLCIIAMKLDMISLVKFGSTYKRARLLLNDLRFAEKRLKLYLFGNENCVVESEEQMLKKRRDDEDTPKDAIIKMTLFYRVPTVRLRMPKINLYNFKLERDRKCVHRYDDDGYTFLMDKFENCTHIEISSTCNQNIISNFFQRQNKDYNRITATIVIDSCLGKTSAAPIDF